MVADHARVWARGTTVTDPAHVATAAVLRQRFREPRTVAADDSLVRDLADYDRAFGLDGFDALTSGQAVDLPCDEDVA